MSDTNANTHQLELPAVAMATSTTENDHTEQTLANPTTQESSPRRYTVDPHLQDHRDAKAAASDLRCTQQFLEDYRLSVLGRYVPDKRVQVLLMPSFHLAVARYREIAHPGDRARKAFCSALQAIQETLKLLHEEYERARKARMQAMAHRHGFLMMPIPDRSRRVVVG
jgi:hypothetical protein